MQFNIISNWTRITVLVFFASILTGCGTGDGEPSLEDPITTGILLDAPVSGVKFQTGTQSGMTNANGEFTFRLGEMVSFSIGGIELGVARAKGTVTPVELTGSENPTDQAAVNMLVFLQSIDEDQNPGNGITVSTFALDLAANLDLDFASPNFSTEVASVVTQMTGGANAVVTEEVALANFADTFLSFGGSEVLGFDFPGDELLLNGGFELSAADTECATNWSCFSAIPFTVAADFKRTGAQVLKQFGFDGGAFQDVTASPGKSYTATAYARNDASEALNNLVLLQLSFWNSSDVNIGSFDVIGNPIAVTGGSQVPLPSNSWVKMSSSAIAPEGTSKARITMIHLAGTDGGGSNVTGTNGGSVFWDDASLGELALSDSGGGDTGGGDTGGGDTGGGESALGVFGDSLETGWALWADGAASAAVVTDADATYGDVIEFTTAGQTVVGMSTRAVYDGADGSTFDASGLAANGVIEFDLKMTAAPAATVWKIKLEGTGSGQEIDLPSVPVLDTWVHYSIPLSSFNTFDFSALDNIMIFPAWADNAGAVYRVDNVEFLAAASGGSDTGGGTEALLTVYADSLETGWALWADGAASAAVVMDADATYGDVIEFTTAGQTVVGMSTRAVYDGADGSTFDASGIAADGVIEFDLKMTAAPAATFWKIKLEGTGSGQEIDLPLVPVLDTWVHYSIPLSSFNTFDFTALDNIMIFPAWADNAGAVYRVDNVKFLAAANGDTGSNVSLPASDGFELGDLSGWDVSTVGGTITADDTQAGSGTWSAHLVVGQSQTAAFKFSNLGIGQVVAGDTIDINFDICGTAGSGGEIQPALLSDEGIGGAASRDNMGNIGSPPGIWTRQTYQRTAGSNVAGGITLQLDAVCGGDVACAADVYIDNVSITINGGDLGSAASGESCIGGGGSGPTEPTVAATAPTAPPLDTIAVFSNAYPEITGVDLNPNWGQATVTTTEMIAGNATLKYAGLNYQGTDWSSNAQNLTTVGMDTLHLDFWTADSTELNIYLIDVPGVETAFALTPDPGNWVSIDIPLSSFSGVDLTQVKQFKFVGNGTIFIDNLYFSCTDCGGGNAWPTTPTEAAATPTQASGDVIAVFSDAYTEISGVDLNPNWGQGTVTTTELIAGNATLKYAGLDYQGTDWSSNAQNLTAAGMDTLHVDFWTTDSTALSVFLIDVPGVETAFALTPVFGGWVSIDIPLSSFSGVDVTQVKQFKFVGNGTIFIDNLYFYSGGTGGGGAALVNGDFETGDFTGWTQAPDAGTNVTAGTITLVTSAPGSRADAVARLEAAGDEIDGSQDVLLTQVLAAGTLNVGDNIDVSFDLYGSLAGAGGVVFVELIYLDVNGDDTGSRSFVGGGAPFTPTTTWQPYSDTIVVPSIPDVSGGVVLQLKASCGPVTGCGVDAYFDNVTFTITP